MATGETSKTDCGESERLLIAIALKRSACGANVIALRSGPTGQPVRMTYFPLPLKRVFVPHPRDQSSGVIVIVFFSRNSVSSGLSGKKDSFQTQKSLTHTVKCQNKN